MQKELDLFNRLARLLVQHEQDEPVVTPIPAEELHKTLHISLGDAPASDNEFEEALEALVLNTPRTASRKFFNQLFGGRTPRATLGDLLAVMLNNSMYTYKVAGPQVGIEKEILRHVRALAGYGPKADGTFAPGGSMCNFVAMLMARDAHNQRIRQEGVQGKLISYTSSESHYSVPKNAAFLGLGREQVRYVACNERGEMLASDLDRQIQGDLDNGFQPFFVNATAGTTVLGAFDDINAISEVTKKHNLWLHIDGAYCGGAIFSNDYKHLLSGLEKTDSFSFNAHKMLGTPLSCSILITQDRKHLHDSLSNDASYLYQTDSDDYNLGKTSIQCGRRNDALKLWSLWKSVGTSGLEKMVNHQFHLADVAREYVRNHPDYTDFSIDNSVSVCFNYKGIPAQKLCTGLYESGRLVVGYGSFGDDEFVRLVTVNAGNSPEDILDFFADLEKYVAEIYEQQPTELHKA